MKLRRERKVLVSAREFELELDLELKLEQKL